MMLVVIAALPGILVQSWFFGWGTVIQLMLAIITAWLAESLVLRLRKQNVVQTLADNSALLTGLLLAISIPPFAPWWMVVLGTVFAVIIAKQLYGGLGQNPFNPAMIGYVVLLISFPVQMTSWLPPHEIAASTPGFIDAVQMIFTGHTVAGQDMNALKWVSMASARPHRWIPLKPRVTPGSRLSKSSTALSIMAHWPASAGSGSILRIWWVACFCCGKRLFAGLFRSVSWSASRSALPGLAAAS
jgi:RnfABCDGE-type electron transport complex D subunit